MVRLRGWFVEFCCETRRLIIPVFEVRIAEVVQRLEDVTATQSQVGVVEVDRRGCAVILPPDSGAEPTDAT